MSSRETKTEQRRIRRANDAAASDVQPPARLFGNFWFEGEVALLFGAAGSGKSLLAVEIAEAIARGTPIGRLQMPTTPRPVLYVDLVLTDRQFAMRYMADGAQAEERTYEFSEQFYRDRPADDERLVDWLRTTITQEKISIVMIDDLSMITRSNDGTRETLKLVRELRRMTRELGCSVLVIADSQVSIPERAVGEIDLRRTRILCSYADSVFALSGGLNDGRRCLVQMRSQAGLLIWTNDSPARFELVDRDNGFVGFELQEFDLDVSQRELILDVKEMHEMGYSFRTIAKKLNLSKSTVARLVGK